MDIYSLIKDLALVGFPSAVAIIEILNNRSLTSSNHQKDLKIEQLKIASDEKKETLKRTGNLILTITEELSDLQHAINDFLTIEGARKIAERENIEFNENDKDKLKNAATNALSHVKKSVSTLSKTYLLGNINIIEKSKEYMALAIKIGNRLAHSDYQYEEIPKEMAKLEALYVELFALLGKMYRDDDL